MTAHIPHAAEASAASPAGSPAGTSPLLEHVAAWDGAVPVASRTGRRTSRPRQGHGALPTRAGPVGGPFGMVVPGGWAVIAGVRGKTPFEGGFGGCASRRVRPDGVSRVGADAPASGSPDGSARLSPAVCTAIAPRPGRPWRLDPACLAYARGGAR